MSAEGLEPKGEREIDDHVKIPIVNRRGEIRYFLIDKEDFERVSKYRWYADKKGYVANESGYLHRYIMRAQVGEIVDHKNTNPLDNRKCNLRLCTYAQNCWNKRKYKNNSTNFKGVNYDASNNKFRARICVDGTRYCLGRYFTAEAAGRAYDNAARILHKEFARLNIPDEGEEAA